MELLKNNEMNKFTKKIASITKLIANKTAKSQAKRETNYQAEKEKMDKEVRGVERVLQKPKTKTKHGDTEAPTFEVEFVKDYRNFPEAWSAGLKKLIQMVETHMKKKPKHPPLLLRKILFVVPLLFSVSSRCYT